MQTLRDLMNLVETVETNYAPPPSAQEVEENESLLEAMRRVEALFDY
jgi:hypothetical protein